MSLNHGFSIKSRYAKEIWAVIKPHLDDLLMKHDRTMSDFPEGADICIYPEEKCVDGCHDEWELRVTIRNMGKRLFEAFVPNGHAFSVAVEKLFHHLRWRDAHQVMPELMWRAEHHFKKRIKDKPFALINLAFYCDSDGKNAAFFLTGTKSKERADRRWNLFWLTANSGTMDACCDYFFRGSEVS